MRAQQRRARFGMTSKGSHPSRRTLRTGHPQRFGDNATWEVARAQRFGPRELRACCAAYWMRLAWLSAPLRYKTRITVWAFANSIK